MDDSAHILAIPHIPTIHIPLACPTPTPPILEDPSLIIMASQEHGSSCNGEQLSDGSRRSECGSQEEWPQIRSIVRKIGKLQSNLANERKLYKELSKRNKANEAKLKTYEEEVAKGKVMEEEIVKMKEQIEGLLQRENELLARVGELEEILQMKDEELSDRQSVLAEVQVSNLKRLAEMQDKQRKLNNDNKELADRIRKANAELQKEKKINRELKSEMSGRLEQIQANKDTYLLQEIEQLKAVIDQSKSQREAQLEGDVEALNKRVYQLEEDIRRKDIQLNLMERKKQQAVAEVQEKKDQQSKLQKTVFKTLTDKYNKLNEQVKVLKQQNQQILRTNRLTRYLQQEITFELSPERC